MLAQDRHKSHGMTIVLKDYGLGCTSLFSAVLKFFAGLRLVFFMFSLKILHSVASEIKKVDQHKSEKNGSSCLKMYFFRSN